MSCWELLGIKPISNKKEIKKAYATKIKQLAIDQEPEEFQKLKEAFDQALLLADTVDDNHFSSEMEEPKFFVDLKEAAEEEVSVDDTQNAVQSFADQLSDLYNGKAFFDDLEKWQSLFTKELEWSITDYEHIEGIMQRFLLENYPLLSKRIITFLEEVFGFDKLVEDVKIRTSFSYYWEDIQHVPDYSFECYWKIAEEERIPYFFGRYELYQMLARGMPERNQWRKKLVECQSILSEDPDLLNLQVAYTLTKDVRLAMEHSKWQISGLFAELQALPLNETTRYLSNYIDWLSGNGSVEKLLLDESSELPTLPYSVFLLLTGHIYAELQEYSEAKARFDLLKQIAPSMIQREGRAHVENEIRPKTKSQSSKATWVIVAVVLILLRLVSASNRTSVYKPSELVLPETSTERSVLDFSDLKYSSFMYNNFAYLFYIDTEDDLERFKFTVRHVSEEAESMFLDVDVQQLETLDLENAGFLYSTIDTVEGYGQLIGVYFGLLDEPFAILQLDDDEKIKDVFGEGWTELDGLEYVRIWADMKVRPWTSSQFFFHSFLLTDHREWNMDYRPEFTTEAVKQSLLEHIDYLADTEHQDWTYRDSYDNQKRDYTIFEYKNSEHVLIISYDTYGRIDHVYGESWETLDKNVEQQLYTNIETAEANK
ncbi:hypothetical protein I6N96_14090 [Enterococcus sp. BWM-S5]|uniref:J domain-containing protein n=1 Tax=Enterococcus larvae TaxID=2794352 RepID=A0ABS4CMS6_9ENTE|nr:hypothetical protein [Enterococcus larvae]MBP1047411.1 hypothetical protein [Enterococcus larvae]